MAITGKFQADFSSFNAEVTKAETQLKSFEVQAQGAAASADRIGASSSVATTGVAELSAATTALTTSQNLATLSTEQLDAMIAGEVVAMGTAAAATETAAVSAGAYGSVLFTMAEAEVVATEAAVGFEASLAAAAGTVTAFVASIAPWLVAIGVAVALIKKYVEAQQEADKADADRLNKGELMARATEEAGHAVTTLAEAEKILEAAQRHRLLLQPEVAAQAYIDKLTEQGKKTIELASEEDAREKGLANLGIVIGETVNVEKLMTEARKADADATRKHAAELKKLADEQERFRNSAKNLTTDAVGAAKGLGIYGALIPDLSANTAQFADQTILLGSAVDATKKDVEALERSGRFLSAALVDVRNNLILLPNVSPQAAAALKQINDEAIRGHSILTGFADGLNSIWKGLSGGNGLGGVLENLGKGIINQFGSILTGGITSLINTGIGLLEKGIKKLFSIGGPSQKELSGRELEATFEGQFKDFSTFVNSIGEAYRKIGKTSEQAQSDVKSLLDAEKQGPEAVQAWIDKLQAALDAAAKLGEHAADATGDSQTVAASDTADAWKQYTDEWTGYVHAEGDAAATSVKDSFDFAINIPVHFNVDSLPVVPMASGGSGVVTKPTLFLAGEAGPESFSFARAGNTVATGGDALIAEIRSLRAALMLRPTIVSVSGREIVRATHTVYDGNVDSARTELRELAGTA